MREGCYNGCRGRCVVGSLSVEVGGMSGRQEYRVVYRRAGSAQTQSRKYEGLFMAERFVLRLMAGEAEYGDLVELRIEARDVSPWTTQEKFVTNGRWGW